MSGSTPGVDISSVRSTVIEEPTKKSLIKLRLDSSTVIPTTFRDIYPSTRNPKETILDLLPGEHDGSHAKLFKLDVLDDIIPGGSSARLVADETANEEQRELLMKLVAQLEENGDLVNFLSKATNLMLIFYYQAYY